MEEIVKFLKEAETYYLATVEGDQPRVRPFGTAHIFEGKLYIQTGKKKDVSKQLHANPKVELCAFKGGRVDCSFFVNVPMCTPLSLFWFDYSAWVLISKMHGFV